MKSSIFIPAALLVALARASDLHADVVPPLCATNGTVTTVARLGDTVYLGGNFSLAGPNTGGFVELDAKTGKLVRRFPPVAGPVNAVVPDNGGGWIIGGSFTGVGGKSRRNLAYILRDGSVADWGTEPDGPVEAIALLGNVLYVGGTFSHIGGAPRSNLAAIDIRTGLATDWRADSDGPVHALLLSKTTLYVGGDFRSLGGQSRKAVAEVQLQSAVVTPWNPGIDYGSYPGTVRTLVKIGNTIYAGGNFRLAGGVFRHNLAAFDQFSGQLTPWNPNVTDCDCDDYAPTPYVNQMVPSGKGTVYIAGRFTLVHGQDRLGIAEVDLGTGDATPWSAHTSPSWTPVVNCIALGGNTLFVGANVDSIGGKERRAYAELDRVTGLATDWNPYGDAAPAVLVLSGSRVIAGGAFTTVNAQRRNTLAAMDARTGELKDWNPGTDGYVEVLQAGENCVYAGGHFSRLGGKDRLDLAALDPVTGVPTDFQADADGVVRALAVDGERLYLGGDFARVNSLSRLHAAAVDRKTGQTFDWNPNVDDGVLQISPDGATVYLAGYFRTIGGEPHPHVAAVDAATGLARPWGEFSDQNTFYAIALGESTLVLGGYFGELGEPQWGVMSLDKATGIKRNWYQEVEGRVYDLARLGKAVYVGGSYTTVGGAAHSGIAALDFITGQVLNWDAGLEPPPYWTSSYETAVAWSLFEDGNFVYAAGNIGRAGVVPAGNVVALAPAVLPVVAITGDFPNETSLQVVPSPAHGHASLRFTLPRSARTTLAVFDVRGRRVLTVLDEDPRAAGPHQVAIDTSAFPGGIYFCRLDAPGVHLAQKLVVLD